jgi:hypothetical protein
MKSGSALTALTLICWTKKNGRMAVFLLVAAV